MPVDPEQLIVRDPRICHGQAVIKGTRVMVSVVLDALADGMNEAEILAQYPTLTVEGIRAAAAYGADRFGTWGECVVPGGLAETSMLAAHSSPTRRPLSTNRSTEPGKVQVGSGRIPKYSSRSELTMGQPDDYPQRPVVESTYVKGGAGHACTVKADQTIALSLPNGPQVVDLDVFDAHDPQEHFGSSITRIAFGSHLDVGDDLLSCPPEGQPMLRVVKNTVVDDDGHETSDARAWTHDLLFGRCSRTQRRRRYNSDTPGCQEIITAAISPWALTQYDVHDPLNVFMTTGLDARGKLFHVPSRARAGDEFALRAHRDCLVAMSACPGASSGSKAHGVQVTVFEARTAA